MTTKKTTTKKKATKPKVPACILSLRKNIKELQKEIDTINAKKSKSEDHPEVVAPRTDIALLAQWKIRLREWEEEWEEDLKMHSEGLIDLIGKDKGSYGKWGKKEQYFEDKSERVVIALAYGSWKAGKNDYEVAEACGIGSSSLSRYLQHNVEIRGLRDNIGVNIPKMAQDGLVKAMEELAKNPSTPNAVGQFLKVLQATDEQNYGSGRFKQEVDAEVSYGLTEEEKADADNFLDNMFDTVGNNKGNKWSQKD